MARYEEAESHCLHLQYTCQMLCSFSADQVPVEMQRSEPLYEMKMVDEMSGEMRRNQFSLYSFAIH